MSNSELKSTEEGKFKMRRSFSWDKAFYTNDGFLDAEELWGMIEGDGDDVNHELQKIESLEAKLFQELEASTQKPTNSCSNLSSGKKDSQSKRVRNAHTDSSSSSTPSKTVQPSRSSPLSGGSLGNKVRSPTRRSVCLKTNKATADSPSKTSPGIMTKKKVAPVNTRISRTSPASPVSSGSSSPSSKFGVNQWSKRGSSVPCRSLVNIEKSSAMKTSKPAVTLIPKTQSSISLKIKPPPVISHTSSTSPTESSVSSSTHAVNQRSKLKVDKGSTVRHRSKSTFKNRPTDQTSDQNGKQPATSRTETRSPNASKPRKLVAPKSKTVAAVNAGLKPKSQKTTTAKLSKKQSSAKAKSSENIILISPEVLDIKGKLNALKMEISMQKKERCKETKMGHDESGKGESSSITRKNNQTKPI